MIKDLRQEILNKHPAVWDEKLAVSPARLPKK
jgi:hypothetical protein